MKRFFILLFLFLPLLTYSQDQQDNSGTIKDSYDIIVSEIYPLTYTNSEGDIDGFIYHLFHEFSNIINVTFNYIDLPWTEALNRVKNGQGDIISNIAYSQERDEFLTDRKSVV